LYQHAPRVPQKDFDWREEKKKEFLDACGIVDDVRVYSSDAKNKKEPVLYAVCKKGGG
jgi:hypothetical protein